MKELNSGTAHKTARPEKVIQFGEGNFLRAFVDWIISIMDERGNFDGNVVVVQPIEKGMADVLNAQDGLYHVNLQGRENGEVVNSFRLVDVVSRAVNPYEDFDAYMRLAEQPEVRFVVSNTTEAGIAFDPACRPGDRPAASYPGKLTQLLYHRYRHFRGDEGKGLIVFPCELIFRNGHHLKRIIRQYIDLWHLGEDFAAWFERACGVYATLVDRIVPGFPRNRIGEIREKLQYNDRLVVQGEAFHLWVIEAPESVAREFPAAECGLNVRFVPDEEPYHKRKVTLLNGPHTLLSPVAYLSGVDIVRDACKDPDVGRYVRKVMFEELIETIDLPREELRAFAESVMERFANPFVDHSVVSIMLNAFPKFATRDLPGLKEYLRRKGVLPVGIVFGLAALVTYYKGGKRGDGAPVVPSDSPDVVDCLARLWRDGDEQKVAAGVLERADWWGEDLTRMPGLTALLTRFLKDIRLSGMREALKRMLEQPSCPC